MDLATLIGNKPLLADLQREYEVLKRSDAAVDYEQWIRGRLAQVAAGLQSAPAGKAGRPGPHAAARLSRGKMAAPRHIPLDAPLLRAGIKATPPTQLALTDAPAGAAAAGTARPGTGEPVISVVGTGGAHNSQPQSWCMPQWQGGLWALDMTNVPGADVQAPTASSKAPFITRSSEQDATPARPARPAWVEAASLQSSLQASHAVPLLHAAAQRERRLAVASALARQQHALGVGPQHLRAAERGEGAPAGASKENSSPQLEHVTALAQHLAEQTQGLQQLVQRQEQQLQQQQALLQRVLGDEAAGSAAGAAGPAPEEAADGLPAALKTSWLLKSLGDTQRRQQQRSGNGAEASSSQAGTAGQDAAGQQQLRQAMKQRLKQLLASGHSSLSAAQLAASLQAMQRGRGPPALEAPADRGGSLEQRMRLRAQPRQAVAQAAPAAAAAGRGLQAPAPAPAAGARRKSKPEWDDSLPEQEPRSRRREPLQEARASKARAGPAAAPSSQAQQRSRNVHDGIARLQAAMAAAGASQAAAADDDWEQEQQDEAAEAAAIAAIELRVQQQLQQEQASSDEAQRLQRLADLEGRMLAAIQQMEQRLHAPPPSAPSAAPAGPPPPAAAAVAALDPAVLRDMLRSLDRLEHREQEARRRWLQPQAPGLVLAPGQGAGGGAAAAAHATPAQLPQQLQPAPAEEAEAREEVISDAMLRSVLRGRRRFLRRQQLLQGDLAPAAGLQPTQVVEQVADLLLEELLQEQAAELNELCDSLCDHLFDAEFDGSSSANLEE